MSEHGDTKHEILGVRVTAESRACRGGGEPFLRLMNSRVAFNYRGERTERDYAWVSRNGERGIRCDAIVVAAIHLGDDGVQRLVVTDEYRVPVETREYGFPAGLVEDGLSPEDTVIKELWEECDLHVTEILKIPTPILTSSAGMTNESVKTFYCYCKGTPSRANLHPGEDINTQLLDWAGVDALLHNGFLIGGKAGGILMQQWMQGYIGFRKPDQPPINIQVQGNRATIVNEFGTSIALFQSPAPFESQILDYKRVGMVPPPPKETVQLGG